MTNALSIDIEDWYHAELVRKKVTESERRPFVVEGTNRILDLLKKHNVNATFFVVGEVATANPELIARIHASGHEIGSHGYSHRPVFELSREEFAAELDKFANAMAKIVPEARVVGFRAPTMSLDGRSPWAFSVLKDFGYRYDSSFLPSSAGLFGIRGTGSCPESIYTASNDDPTRPAEDGAILEFPLNVCTVAGFHVPVPGGFFLRVTPVSLLKRWLKRVNRHRPFVLYVHPWEVCPEIPRVNLSPAKRFVTYYNLGSTLDKLEQLLETFQFQPMANVLSLAGK